MVIVCIVKERISRDSKKRWYSFSTIRNGKWYDVKFVHDAAAPAVYDIDKPNKIMRAFIDIEQNDVDIAQHNGRDILYVNKYTAPSTDMMKSCVTEERDRIKKFRDERKQKVVSFFSDSIPPQEVETGIDKSGLSEVKDLELGF